MSSLKDFNLDAVDWLIKDGVRMFYDHSMGRNEPDAVTMPGFKLIGINPHVRKKGKKYEDLTILHEWLHAYGLFILEIKEPHDEEEIDYWARELYKGNPTLIGYIRENGVLQPEDIKVMGLDELL